MEKYSYKTLLTIVVVLLIGIVALLRLQQKPRSVLADWWNDSWNYRQVINVTSHTSLENNVYIIATINIGSTTKSQPDNGDFRFTNLSGDVLSYYISANAGTTAPTFHIQIPTFPAGAQTFFAYYGNNGATNGFSTSGFSTQATSYTIGSYGTEERGGGPIAWWKFDESSGSTFYDSSGHNYHATLGSGSLRYETGKFGRSFQTINADSVTDRLDVGDIEALDFSDTQSFTISTWFRHIAKENSNYFVYYKGAEVNTSSGYNMGLNSSSKYQCNYTDGNGSGMDTVTSVTTGNSDWHLVTCVMDRTGTATGTIGFHIFVDGKLEASDTSLTEGSAASNTHTIQLGETDSAYEMGMGLDDFKIFGYAQTPTQIKNEYNHSAEVNIGNDSTDIITKGLVGYWKFDENIGTTTVDSSGNSNLATFATGSSAPSWSNGKYGVGLSFNGTTNYATIADNDSLSFANNTMSAAVWVKRLGNPAVSEFIILKGLTGWEYSMRIGTSGTIGATIYQSNGTNSASIGTSNQIIVTDGNWHHVVFTADGFALKVYVDGVLDSTVTTFTGTMSNTGATLYIGDRSDTPDSLFEGKLDELRLYNRALNPSEIRQLADIAPGPIGYWKMEESSWTNNCSTTTVKDSSGNNLNLTSCPSTSGPVGNDIGKYGKSGNFDGVDDYLESASTTLNISSAITMSAWVKPTTVSINDDYVVNRTSTNAGYALGWASAMNPKIRIGNSVAYTDITGVTTLAIGKWYYLSATVDPDGNAKIYVNGNLDIASTNIVLASSTGQNFRIGSRTAGNQIAANIDEVKIYNYARTPEQIIQDMQGGNKLSGPIAYYKFDEGRGSTSGNSGSGGSALNATLNGSTLPAWINSGKVNKAISIDGEYANSDDYVSIPDNNNLEVQTGPFTVSAWINRQGDTIVNGSVFQPIISKGRSTTYTYQLLLNASDRVTLNLYDGTNNPSLFSVTAISSPGWHHVVGIYDGSNMLIYIDGKLEKTDTAGAYSGVATVGDTEIGVWPFQHNTRGHFNGFIDEVKIYNYALSADEVKLDYNLGSSIVVSSSSQTIGATTTSLDYCIPGDTSPCTPPVAEWKLDEPVTPAFDTSGNGSTASWAGNTTSTIGKIGTAVTFDGTGDYLNAGSPTTLDNLSAFSINTWVYTNADSGRIIDKQTSSNTGGWQVELKTSGSHVQLAVDYDTTDLQVEPSATLAPNTWYNIAVTWDGTVNASGVKIYINGILQTTFTNNISGVGTRADDSAQNIGIGCRAQDASQCMSGKIDQLLVYNYVRTPAQVAYDYNKGGPIAWWKFDECQGSVANDSSGIGNTGSISIGASGTQTSAGTCSTLSTSWGIGSTGKINSSLNFDGIDDEVVISSNTSLDFNATGQYAVSFWSKAASDSEVRTFIVKSNTGNGYSISQKSNGRAVVYFPGASNNNNVNSTCQTNSALPTTIWSHITFIWNNGQCTLYLNGILQSSVSVTGAINNTSSNTWIGMGTDKSPPCTLSFGCSINGQVDDVRVYNYPLTSTQIKAIYNGGSINFK